MVVQSAGIDVALKKGPKLGGKLPEEHRAGYKTKKNTGLRPVFVSYGPKENKGHEVFDADNCCTSLKWTIW